MKSDNVFRTQWGLWAVLVASVALNSYQITVLRRHDRDHSKHIVEIAEMLEKWAAR